MLTPIDFYYLAKELEEIVNYKLKDVYFFDNNFIFEFKLKQDRKFFVVGKNYCYLTTKEIERKENKFTLFLLKKLKNRKLTKVLQDDFNKIVIFSFGDLKLIFEFIGKGNIILCKNSKIISALYEREFKDRKILRGENYISPKNEYSPEIREKEKLLKLHIGEIYADEIKKRNLSLGDILKEEISPALYFKNGKKFFVSPFELKTLKLEKKKKKSFSEAVEEFYRKKSKEEIIKEMQKKNLEKYEKEEKEFRIKAELLLKYKKEIEKAFEIWKNEKKIIKPIKKISEAKIFLEIEGKALYINFGKDLKKEIDDLYRKAKKAREKIEKIKELINKELKERKIEKVREKKEEWYEKFRYFFTSDGFLVIAGKDAESNEKIIKKYCKENDIVLHAHISGSPFAIVRGESKKISEKAIKEAAQFVACYSRFWNSKLGIADVYWVKPEQVSKKVPGHQTIKKGSFMIYGKRNFLRVELKFCIGLNEKFKIVKGPEEAVKKYAKYYVTIVPGEKQGKELGNGIKEKLMKKAKKKDKEKIAKINIDEFLKVVPYGRGEVL
jgi:predicted ribosome quality control (RQC) complex YloA/Tae2 family protein